MLKEIILPASCRVPSLLVHHLVAAAAGEDTGFGKRDKGKFYQYLADNPNGVSLGQLHEFVAAEQLDLGGVGVPDVVLAGVDGGWLSLEKQSLIVKPLYKSK